MATIKLFMIVFSLFLSSTNADESIDTREGADLILKCRFTEHYDSKDFTFYWARWTCCPTQFENVAIGDVQLNSNYRLDFRPGRGIYDLQIKNTSYNRDNGRFECRIKAKGTGADVHQEFYNLTVLTPPHPPIISPGNIAVATEDKPLELTCSSIGGSPDPMITWYREGSTVPLQSYILKGGSKNHYTNATLQILPRRVDDGAKYKCVVWNRAMTEGHTLETTVALNVNYYPRVEVGPQNPLRVERDHVAKLDCRVDAKPMVSNVRWTRNGQYVSTTPVHTIYRVNRHHAGKYTCTADNGLGKTGEKDLILDVLYPPIVVIETKTHEAEEGETVLVRCNVTANPPPITIEWLKEGASDFRFMGELLTLVSVRADNAGNYICRAVNLMQPYGTKRVEGVGNSTVALLVRHRPGQAYITPNKPVVHVGNGVTLSCSANPPGWPVPQYRWFRDMDGEFSNTQKILAQGPQYSIPKAHLGSEGKYHCHAVNELGIGKLATITLEVHQPPQFLAKLQQHMTRRVGDVDYAVTCSAKAKPAPIIRWIKDGTEILPGRKMYDIRTTPTETSNGVVTVQSILKFRGKGRPNGNQLVPADRGLFSCLYENEVNSANSSMHLRIEHEPIVLHQYNKVAYDVRESAEVICKVQAYPKPEFQWQFGNNPSPLTMSSDGHYEISTRVDNNDIYTSILRINHISHSDYGDYACRAVNPLDTIRTQIHLQPKGPPERPTNLKVLETSHNFVILSWIPGFNGGMLSTKFLVTYRRVPTPREQLLSDCGVVHSYASSSVMSSPEWHEFDCFRDNPCKVAPLDQHQSYMFKIYALNAKGSSGYSNEMLATTKVSKIPPPLHVTYDPNSHIVGINVAATCLSLIAIVESLVNRASPMATWEIVDTVTLLPSGNEATFKETTINHISQRTHYSMTGGRSMSHAEDITLALAENKQGPSVRVKLCLRSNHDHCGEYTNAEIGKSYLPETSSLTTSAIVAIVIATVTFLLFAGFSIMLCRCRRSTTSAKKSSTNTAKEYDLDSGRPSIVAQTSGQQPPPPPYYPTGSLDSKTLAMELTLTAVQDNDNQLHHQQQHQNQQQQQQQQTQKSSTNSLYGTQNGYGYHMTSAVGIEGDSYQVIPSSGLHTLGGSTEWSSTHYPASENNYTNSNSISASIGSNQDTLWHMKMTAAAAMQKQQQHQQQQQQQSQLQTIQPQQNPHILQQQILSDTITLQNPRIQTTQTLINSPPLLPIPSTSSTTTTNTIIPHTNTTASLPQQLVLPNGQIITTTQILTTNSNGQPQLAQIINPQPTAPPPPAPPQQQAQFAPQLIHTTSGQTLQLIQQPNGQQILQLVHIVPHRSVGGPGGNSNTATILDDEHITMVDDESLMEQSEQHLIDDDEVDDQGGGGGDNQREQVCETIVVEEEQMQIHHSQHHQLLQQNEDLEYLDDITVTTSQQQQQHHHHPHHSQHQQLILQDVAVVHEVVDEDDGEDERDHDDIIEEIHMEEEMLDDDNTGAILLETSSGSEFITDDQLEQHQQMLEDEELCQQQHQHQEITEDHNSLAQYTIVEQCEDDVDALEEAEVNAVLHAACGGGIINETEANMQNEATQKSLHNNTMTSSSSPSTTNTPSKKPRRNQNQNTNKSIASSRLLQATANSIAAAAALDDDTEIDSKVIAEFINQQTCVLGTGRYKCNLCQQEFKQFKGLHNHMHSHSNWIRANCKKQPQCEICHKTFKGPGMLRMHMKTHQSAAKIPTCHICGKTFKSKAILYRHRHIHQQRSYACAMDNCRKHFSSAATLKAHAERKHPQALNVPKFKCGECNNHFFDVDDLHEHVQITGHGSNNTDSNNTGTTSAHDLNLSNEQNDGNTTTTTTQAVTMHEVVNSNGDVFIVTQA